MRLMMRIRGGRGGIGGFGGCWGVIKMSLVNEGRGDGDN